MVEDEFRSLRKLRHLLLQQLHRLALELRDAMVTEPLARVMIEAEDHAAMTHHAEAIANAIRDELGA